MGDFLQTMQEITHVLFSQQILILISNHGFVNSFYYQRYMNNLTCRAGTKR